MRLNWLPNGFIWNWSFVPVIHYKSTWLQFPVDSENKDWLIDWLVRSALKRSWQQIQFMSVNWWKHARTQTRVTHTNTDTDTNSCLLTHLVAGVIRSTLEIDAMVRHSWWTKKFNKWFYHWNWMNGCHIGIVWKITKRIKCEQSNCNSHQLPTSAL